MDIDWQIGSPSQWRADAVIFFTFEDGQTLPPGFRKWQDDLAPWLLESPALKDFSGKAKKTALLYGPAGGPIPRVVAAGLGKVAEFDPEKVRGAMSAALRRCRELELETVALPLMALEGLPMDPAVALEEALVGGGSGLYRYVELKTRDRETFSGPTRILLLSEEAPSALLGEASSRAEAVLGGLYLTRDLATAPSNRATPAFLVEAARLLAERHSFRLDVIDEERAALLGMGGFVAVAQGSREPSYVIILEHAPPGHEDDPPLVFVGKGITFDTGGISIKPSHNMEAMKHDMAGAAAVLGTFEVLGRLRAPQRVIGIMPCTENMPDGKAYKPGDVIHTLAGLTVEVISTDAEGRMVLCDALTYARRFEPAAIIDIATLTGAALVALGKQVAAVMGNHDELTQQVQEVGMRVGEKLWPLPLWSSYFDLIKSDVADFKNVGERTAGTIVGGIFLKQFVPDEIPWVHIDIAGTAWADKELNSIPKGATGFGVRILTEIACRWKTMRGK